MSRLRPFLLAALVVACADGDGTVSAPRAKRVILISCDTLRADRLGVYGYALPTSPALDAFAREALVFDAAWSTAPLTGPAMAAVFTGRMPEELGLASNRQMIAPQVTTLAETLSAAGIETAAIVSNWVLREQTKPPGAGISQGFAHYDDEMETLEVNRGLQERIAQDTTDAALAWLAGRPSDSSFFLWVHFQDPHGPYTPPAEFVQRFQRPLGDEPPLEPAPEKDQRGHNTLPGYQQLGDERRPETYRIRYDAEIAYFDQELGRLLEGLRASGLDQDALIVFTADHGESLGEHEYWFSHGQHLHRELLQVPLLVRYPSGGPRPTFREQDGLRRVSEPVSHLDLAPTVLEAFGLDTGAQRGTSLFRERLDPARVLPQSLREAWSATSASHRLIVSGEELELYDLERDPGELVDLAQREPERVRELAERRRAFLGATGDAPRAEELPLDEETLRGLKALGYEGEDEGDGDAHGEDG